MVRYPNKSHAIAALGYGNREFVVRDMNNENNGDVEWINGDAPVTDKQINDKLAELKTDAAMWLLRRERNRFLSECDWTQGADVPSNFKSAWTTYRQELRDLPASAEPEVDSTGRLDFSSVTWPTKPE